MTEAQKAQLMRDRIKELRFILKRKPTQEEIQESIRERPIDFTAVGVTDLTNIAQSPGRTVPVVQGSEEPGDVPINNNQILELAKTAQGDEKSGFFNVLEKIYSTSKTGSSSQSLPQDAEDLSNEGTEVMRFNYLEGPGGYYPITPLKQNVGTSGSLTFDETDTLTQETPAQKRARINATRKTVLSDPGLVEKPEVCLLYTSDAADE